MTAVESADKPKVKCDAPDTASPSAVARETDLSQNQLKKEEVCTATTLPPVTLMDGAKPALSDAAVATSVQDIKTALNIGGWSASNFDQIKNVVSGMNGSDMARLESAYAQPGQPGLRQQLRENLKPDQYRQIEALLDRKDGKPNLPGSIAVAIETAKKGGDENRETAGRMLRSTMETLTTDQITQLKKDWDAKYGKEYGTFDQAIQAAKFNDSDKRLVVGEFSEDGKQIKPAFFSKGVNERTPEDIAAAAKYVVGNYNATEWDSTRADQYLRQLSDVLGGTGPAAVAARKALQGDKDFMASFDKAFGPGTYATETQKSVAKDLLSDGRISLGTIVTGNTKTLGGFFDNPDNISLAMSQATPQERADFTAGKHLADAKRDRASMTPAEQKQFDLYNKLEETFKSRAGDRQAAAYTEQLMYGNKGLISAAAATHSDGSLFGIGAGHSTQALFNVFEKTMTPEQWQMLRPKNGQESEYMRDLKASLSKYATPDEMQRLTAILDAKSKATSFDAAQGVRRPLDQVIHDNADDTPEARKAIADRFQSMTPAEAKAFAADPKLQGDLTKALDAASYKDTKDVAAEVLARSLAEQVIKTGKPPQLTPLDQFAKDVAEGKLETMPQKMAASEKLLLSDPALRKQLNDIQAERDKGTMSSDYHATQGQIALTALFMETSGGTISSGYRALLRGEQIGIGDKISASGGLLNGGFQGRYPDIAAIQPQSERDRIVGMLKPEQQAIVQNVIKQGGKADMADDAASYLAGDGGSYRDFVQKLAKMSDADKTAFYKSFQDKYGKDFKSAFVEGAASRESVNKDYKAVLDKLVTQNFKPTLADELRLKVLDGTGSPYQQFSDRFKQLTPVQMDQLKSEYASKYSSDLSKDFLGQVDNPGAKLSYERMLKGIPSDPISDFIERNATMDLTGANVDGSQLNMERALQVNRDLLEQYQANRQKLPPEVRDKIDKYFTDATQGNLDSKERVAKMQEAVIDGIVITAAAASLIASGGTSSLVIAGIGVTASAARPFAMQDALGSKTITPEQFKEAAIRGGIDAALFMPVGVLARSTKVFNELRGVEKTGEVVENLAKGDQVAPLVRAENTGATVARTEEVAATTTVRTAEETAAAERQLLVGQASRGDANALGQLQSSDRPMLAKLAETNDPIAVKALKDFDRAQLIQSISSGNKAIASLTEVERGLLREAAASGNKEAIAQVTQMNRAPLAKAAESGTPDAVKALQEFDRSTLAEAVARGEKTQADLAAFDRGVLEKAAAGGDKGAIAKLTEMDRAPLAQAAESGNPEAVKALQDFDRSALLKAVERGEKTQADVAAFDRGVLEKAAAGGDKGAIAKLTEMDRAPLAQAAESGNPEAVRALQDFDRSALLKAVERGEKTQADVAAFERGVLEHAAASGDKHAIQQLNDLNRAPLAKAAETGDAAAVKALQDFDRSALVKAIEAGDKTPADLAAFDRKVLEQSAAHGDKAAIAKLTELDRAPLAKAAESGDAASVKALQDFDRNALLKAVERGEKTQADVAAFDRGVLEKAAAGGDKAAIAKLTELDRAPLVKAAESGDAASVKALQDFDRNALAKAVERGEKTQADLAAFDRGVLEKAAAGGDKAAIAKLTELDRAPLAKAAESGDPAAVKALQDFDRSNLAKAVERGEKTQADLAAFDRKVLEEAATRGDKEAIAKLTELDRAPLAKAAESGDPVAVKALENFDRKALERAAAAGDKQAIDKLAALRKAELDRVVNFGRQALIAADAAMKLGVPALAVEHRMDKPAEQPKPVENPPIVPSDKLIGLATVRRGEGPWQSAERILASDGKKHSIDEVRALTKAIQAAYKQDNNGNGDMSGLKVKYSFAGMSPQTFGNIVANCKDDKVKALLMSLAKH